VIQGLEMNALKLWERASAGAHDFTENIGNQRIRETTSKEWQALVALLQTNWLTETPLG
jgi:hypothetical protein